MIDVFPTLRSPRKTSLYFARGGNPFDAFDPELDCFVLPFVVTPVLELASFAVMSKVLTRTRSASRLIGSSRVSNHFNCIQQDSNTFLVCVLPAQDFSPLYKLHNSSSLCCCGVQYLSKYH